MKHYFPDTQKGYTYLQTNRSDKLGSLWSTFNTDYQSNLGVTRLSQKLVTNTTSVDDSDLGRPSAFEVFKGNWWAVCGTRIFSTAASAGGANPDLTLAFAEDASTGAQTDYLQECSDLGVFDNRLWSTTTDALYSFQGTTWTSRDTLSSGTVHKIEYFRKFNRLYYTDNNTEILSINNGNTVASSGDYYLNLSNTISQITTITSNSDFIWIGTTIPSSSSLGEKTKCSIFTWDGISNQITQEYPIEAAAVLAMVTYNNIVYAFDSNGRILKFTGYSFEEVGRLPVTRTLLSGASLSAGSSHFVHFNGFQATKDNTLMVLVNNRNYDENQTISENLPSGIWELDLATYNFTHRYSFTLKGHASSTITDFGQNRILSAGALKISPFAANSSRGQSRLLAGALIYTNDSDSIAAIYIDSPVNQASDTEGQKKGYFVSTWFESEEIEDMWTRLWSIHKRFSTETDNIVYKYRFIEEPPLEASITWVDTTSFTTTTDVTAYGPTASGFDGSKGGEVEGIQGTGSGATAHITNIVNNAGTYTVTLDTAITGVTTGTAKARFQKWIPLPPMTDDSISYGNAMIGKPGTKIQTKVCMSFTGDGEHQKMIMFSNKFIEINS